MRLATRVWIPLLVFLLGPPAQGELVSVVGDLEIEISSLDPIQVDGSGTAITSPGPHLDWMALGGSTFATTGLILEVTDPFAAPIFGLQLTVDHDSGLFLGGSAPGALGGEMALSGVLKVCLFAFCSASFVPANLSLPLSVVGVGGTATAPGLVSITTVGAPWFEGTVNIGSVTEMGFAHGPGSGTSSTAQAGGVVQLVSPIHIQVNIPASPILPSFARLTLQIVPEPSTIALVGAGIVALGAAGRRRLSG